ncbi:MAG TPA: FlgD immunoglobulin-like domain containing protein, partial [Candidatus Limnocylindrales bacterium]|nr:FlgD immunoglobulin-like domain containing protein [Candidatus Limnocylindrales bacterium]
TGTSAPQRAVRAFSPNGDGSEDGLVLRWTNASKMDAVKVRVLRPDGTLIGTRTLPDRAAGAQAWTWDGKVDRSRLKDGSYLLQLVAVRDGRTFRAPSARPATKPQRERYGVRIDTKAPSITKASATEQVISPDGDRYRDSTKLTLTASGGAVRWTATVVDAKGRTIRSKAGTGAIATFTWNGRTNAGRRAADGRYLVTLTLFDAAGNPARRSGTVTLDTTAPSVKPATSAAAISPNGDGLLDAATLSFRANEPVSGTARLYKGDRLVRSWKVANAAAWEKAWDGRRADGRAASDGVYTLRVTVRDAGGNDRTAGTRIVLDRTLKGLAWQRHFHPQDGDTLQPTSALRFGLTRDAVTTLRIYDARGRVVRTAWKGRSLADGTRMFTWDGKRDDGSWAPQGRYLAKLRVRGPHATIEYGSWVWASAFTVTPNRTTVKAGQRLVVRFRSVERLSTTPRVSFTQPGRSAVTVKATRLADGSFRATFTVRTGNTGAGSVRVSATDAGGAVNATKIPIRVGS